MSEQEVVVLCTCPDTWECPLCVYECQNCADRRMEVKPCIEQPCPYMGYTDTKKCWFHSRGVPAPPIKVDEVLKPVGPMTFAEALAEGEEYE